MKTKSLRILVAGHAGLKKTAALHRLRDEIIEQKPDSNVAIVEAEDGISDMPAFLGLDLERKQAQWQKSVIAAIEGWKSLDPMPDITLLNLHLSYLWQSHLFSPMAWPVEPVSNSTTPFFDYVKREFKPDIVVILIDDVQAVQSRTKSRGYEFRLREIMHWRDSEILLAELLASHVAAQKNTPLYPHENALVVAVRHSPNMLYRLLFDRQRLRIYTSFPIGAPRRLTDMSRRKAAFQEIDRFRRKLAEDFTVFDPLTIDEFPMQYKCDALKGAVTEPIINLPAGDQWTIPAEETLCDEDRQDVQLETSQVAEIALKLGAEGKSEIARQTQIRDHRLIDQSDIVVVYRPTMLGDGDWSHGTYDEASYAYRRGKPFIVIRDKAEDPALAAKTLGLELTPASTASDLSGLSNPEIQNRLLEDIKKRVQTRCEKTSRGRLEG